MVAGAATVVAFILSWQYVGVVPGMIIGALAGVATAFVSYKPRDVVHGVIETAKEIWPEICAFGRGVLGRRYSIIMWVILTIVAYKWAQFQVATDFPRGGGEAWVIPLTVCFLGAVFVAILLAAHAYATVKPDWISGKTLSKSEINDIENDTFDNTFGLFAGFVPCESLKNWLIAGAKTVAGPLFLLVVVLIKTAVAFGRVPEFLRRVNSRIHSKLRTMAMVDGSVGGGLAISLAFLTQGAGFLHASPFVQLGVVALGSALALGFGYLNYLVIAPRLGVAPKA